MPPISPPPGGRRNSRIGSWDVDVGRALVEMKTGSGLFRPASRRSADLAARRDTMNRGLRPCVVCGIPSRGARCPEHAVPRRGWAHERASKQVRLEEVTCWICGEPAKPGDPLTGDHIVPRISGGADVRENMRSAHRSSNSRRGAGEGGYVGIEGNAGRSLTTPPRNPKVSTILFLR
jgi:hypothetical protein